jgi:hypothetical protein
MSLPTLTPTEQKTIEMADTICGALMRPGWFESIDQANPWADDSLLIRADKQCLPPVAIVAAYRRPKDVEAGR